MQNSSGNRVYNAWRSSLTLRRTVSDIKAIAQHWQQERDLKLIIISDIGLMTPDNSEDTRQKQFAKIAQQLKSMAVELRMPVFCLAELFGQTDSNEKGCPGMSQLVGSRHIEPDADVVMFIHREENDATGKAELIVAKQRNGVTGTIDLIFPDYAGICGGGICL